MGYSIDLKKAAIRHLAAAKKLDDNEIAWHKAVAGYLYGISAECALKQLVKMLRFKTWTVARLKHLSKDDLMWKHFPELRTALRDKMQGRSDSRLLPYTNDKFMSNWDIAMRYAPATDIKNKQVELWKLQAERIVNAMNTEA